MLQTFPIQTQKSNGLTSIPVYDSIDTLVYMEDLTDELEKKFIKNHLEPYFKGIFEDLALRSSTPAKESKIK